ncbi:Xylanase inhibitor, C-terminal [Dillenia turbinata]|uniref:Xylanase inhibitor, C-terminal n=1 Tax=Dillenia turbinata TaxID=194707 RepID=A0AAN8VU82_9MAGN
MRGPFSSLRIFDTCFNATKEGTTPVVTLHFTELDLKLPVENTLIRRSSGSVVCLAMAEAPNNVNSVQNVIANLQQQNLRIKFDVANSRVGIAREVCAKS